MYRIRAFCVLYMHPRYFGVYFSITCFVITARGAELLPYQSVTGAHCYVHMHLCPCLYMHGLLHVVRLCFVHVRLHLLSACHFCKYILCLVHV